MSLIQSELFARNTHGYDLHTHSTASDGSLTPEELIDAAIALGIKNLALSDHDTVDGYYLAKEYLSKNSRPIHLIPSAEFSSRWNTQTPDNGQGMTVHIVALNIDPQHAKLQELIHATQIARTARNSRIQHKMQKKGWADVYQRSVELSQGGQLTRTHMANAMLQTGKISSYRHAFSRYLGDGKSLAVHTRWPTISETVSCITQAGGTAVLAHPMHYRLTRKKLLQLCSDFKNAGGQAIEVITGRATKLVIEDLTGIALRQNLAASVGSDFHSPEKGICYLGVQQTLPSSLTPVWEIW